MKILIIGHSVIDNILVEGDIQDKLGGIVFSAAALDSCKSKLDKIFISTAVSNEYKHLFNTVYKNLKNNFIEIVDEIPKVSLIVHQNKEREETYSSKLGNLLIDKINFNLFDGIYINMVSGFDININQLYNLRKSYSGIIYFDVHTFARGFDSNNRRIFRKIPDFSEWAKCINILQANESELKTLSYNTKVNEIIKELLNLGIEQVIVTKGKNGASVYFKEFSEVKSISANAINVKSITKIGCGDVFGALYFYNYISNKNILGALTFANIGAGISTTFSDISEFKKLKHEIHNRIN